MKTIFRLLLLAVALHVPLTGQSGRTLTCFDGHPDEDFVVEGRGRFHHEAEHVRQGLGSLGVYPLEGTKFYGVTVFDLRVDGAKALSFDVYQPGDASLRYRIRLDDASSKTEGYGTVSRDVPPGWSTITVSLTDVTTPKGRTLQLGSGIRRFQFSRKADAAGIDGFLIDGLRAQEEAASVKQKDLAQRLRADDEGSKHKLIREQAILLPADERLAFLINRLASATDEQERTAWRSLAITCDGAKAEKTLLAALKKTRDEERRIELCWILGSLPTAEAWREGAALAVNPKTAPWERTALLRALARRHRAAYALLPAPDPKEGWPLAAAFVEGLLLTGTGEAIDRLIPLLGEERGGRVMGDAEDALVALTGKDLGSAQGQWKDWWAVNRESYEPGFLRKSSDVKRPYGRFFGIPVRTGRIAFVLDLSGSMRSPVRGGNAEKHIRRSEHLKTASIDSRLDLAKAELLHALSGLGVPSEVAVIVYNDEVTMLTKGLEPASKETIAKLSRRIETLTAGQKTNIHDGLFAAFHPGRRPSLKEDFAKGPDTIFLLTDGNPSAGPITRHNPLRDAVVRWNLGRAVKIHTINVGDTNATMLKHLATRSGGVFLDLSSDEDKDENR